MKISGRKREWSALLGKTHATISPILFFFFFNMAVGRRFSLYWTGFVVWSRGMFIGYDID